MELTVVLLSLFTVAEVNGFPRVWKFWVPNTNYDNPSNWDQGRLPRNSDRVIFPADLELGVSLPEGVTVLRQLVLPVNGEIFLPILGELRVRQGQGAGEDVTWMRRGAWAWLDPGNWRTDARSADALVPHVERLPCSADTVVFPANSSFRVRLPEVAVPVGSLQLRGGELTDAEWQAWLNTEAGYRQFVGREEDRATAVSVKEVPMCLERSGCVCGQPVRHSSERMLQEVCKYASAQCAEDVPCYSPIRPEGHCCDICGGYLTLYIEAPAFDIEGVRRRVDQLLASGEYPGVFGHVGRSSTAHAQVVLVERPGQYDEGSVALAGVLKEELLKSKLPGVLGVNLHTSGARYLGSRWVSASSTMLGSLFAVVLFMGLVYLLFVAYPSETRFAGLMRFREAAYPFRFARFENLPGEGEADCALQLGCEAVPDEATSRQAFDNPLYGQTKDEPAATDLERHVTQSNPVYSELQHTDEAKGPGEEGRTEDDEGDTDTETEVDDNEVFDEINFGGDS